VIELLAGVGVGLLAGASGNSHVPDTSAALREQAKATREAGKQVSRALGGLAVATEATGHREVVHYRETIWTTREGVRVWDVNDLRRLLNDINKEPRWGISQLHEELEAEKGKFDADPEKILVRHGRLLRFEVYHYWSVVVGLEVARLAYRCLPDGMAREIHSNPDDWE